MKLAKKLGAITLATTMALTSVPVVMANEVQAVEATIIQEITQVEELEAVEVYAADTTESASVISARKEAQTAIDSVKELDEIDYTNYTWTQLNDAVTLAEKEVAKVKGDSATDTTYNDDAIYRTALRAAADSIYTNVEKLDALQPLVDAIAKAEKADPANYGTGVLEAAITVAKSQLEIFKGLNIGTSDDGTVTVATTIATLNVVVNAPTAGNAKIDLAIEEANGLTATDYTKYSYQAVLDAVEAAQADKKDEDADKEAAAAAITTAIGELVPVTEFLKVYDEATALAEKNYTATSWSEFKIALSNAKVVYNNINNVAKEVEKGTLSASKSALETALKALDDVSKLDEVVTRVKAAQFQEKDADENANYTENSWNAYELALGKAEKALEAALIIGESDITSQADINVLVNALLTATYGTAIDFDAEEQEEAKVEGQDGLVYIAELRSLISEKDDYEAIQKDYSSESYGKYTTAILGAEGVIAKSDATAKEVKDATEAITTAKDGLVVMTEAGLADLIADVEDIVEHKDYFVEKDEEGVFEESSHWDTLETALKAAKEAKNPTSTEIETLISGLTAAKDAVVGNSLVNAEVVTLNTLITRVKAYEEATYVSSSWTALSTSLEAAQVVLKEKYPTKENIVSVTKALQKAENDKVVADKNSLRSLITAAQALKTNDYEETSYEAFKVVLDNTLKAYSNIELEAIKGSYDSLESAMKSLVAKDVTKVALQDLVAGVADYNENGFTDADKFEAFTEALEAAQTVLTAENVLQKDIDAAKNALEVAIEALEKSAVNRTTLTAELDKFKGLNETDYTVASWMTLQNAIVNAEKALAGEENVSVEIKEAQAALKAVTLDDYNKSSFADNVAAIKLRNNTKDKDYTVSSWENYKAELKVAEETEATATSQLRAIEKALVVAEKGLVKADKVAAQAAITVALEKVEADHTAESWLTFAAALEKAQVVVKAGGPYSQYRVVEDALVKAMANLVEAEVVVDEAAPALAYEGELEFTVENGAEFVLPEVTATDNVDEAVEVVATITLGEEVVEAIDTTVAGTYTITYTAVDAAGNEAEAVVITVVVNEAVVVDEAAPVLAYEGKLEFTVENGVEFVMPEVTATDNVDEAVEVVATITLGEEVVEAIDTTVAGTYTITYTAVDAAGNEAEAVVITVVVNEAEVKEPTTVDFITDLYETVLGRVPSQEEIDGYNNGVWKGAQMVQHFVQSEEFTAKNLSDKEYVETIYKMALGREADEAGLAYWTSELTNSTRKIVLAMVLGADEFNNYCTTVGLETGSVEITAEDQLAKYPAELTAFINRLYATALGRNAEAIEVLGWAQKLATKEITGSEIGTFFMTSDEFTAKNTTDAEFVKALYTAFFGQADQAGEAYWAEKLVNGEFDRATVLTFFVGSGQFKDICEAAGIQQ